MTSSGNIVSAFHDRVEAERAVDELHQAGFSNDQIGFAIRGTDAIEGGMITDAAGAKDADGAVKGATTGSVIGAVIGAAGAALLPGVGPVLAGGILATAVGGAAAGAAIGGIAGALTGLDVSEEEAVRYEHEFQSGKAIVTVKAGDRCQEAQQIIQRHGGYRPFNN